MDSSTVTRLLVCFLICVSKYHLSGSTCVARSKKKGNLRLTSMIHSLNTGARDYPSTVRLGPIVLSVTSYLSFGMSIYFRANFWANNIIGKPLNQSYISLLRSTRNRKSIKDPFLYIVVNSENKIHYLRIKH